MEKLKSLDYRVVVLVLLSLSAPFVSPSFGLPMSILCFSGLVAFKMWQDSHKKVDINDELARDLQAIKNQMSGIMIKNAARPEEMAKEIKRFF